MINIFADLPSRCLLFDLLQLFAVIGGDAAVLVLDPPERTTVLRHLAIHLADDALFARLHIVRVDVHPAGVVKQLHHLDLHSVVNTPFSHQNPSF